VTDDDPSNAQAESVSFPLKRSFRGYSRETVDAIVTELTRRLASAEQRVVEAEGQNAALVAERNRMVAEVDRFREIERSLTQTLALAEESARVTEQRAAAEAEQLLARARIEAEALSRDAAADRQRVFDEIDAIRTQLTRALEQLAPRSEPGRPPTDEPVEAPVPAPPPAFDPPPPPSTTPPPGADDPGY
jgi:cell division septum initiation protein DivIVA